jgi:shikimate kinase
MPLVFLIGFMGSGKTTFGKKLAHKLDTPFIDIDELVVTRHYISGISELINAKGIDFFRQAESEVLKGLTAEHAVVSTGGGTPCYFENLEWMKRRGVVVFLKLDEGVIFSRLKTTNLAGRPLLKDLNEDGLKSFIHEKLGERLPYYNQADIIFDPVHEKMEELVAKLIVR